MVMEVMKRGGVGATKNGLSSLKAYPVYWK